MKAVCVGKVYIGMLTNRDSVITTCLTAKNVLTDTTAIEAEMNELVSELPAL